MFPIGAWLGVLFVTCTSSIKLGKSRSVISIEELETKLKNLLVIPDTKQIYRFITKHPSRLFPSYRCVRIEICFSDEVTALKTALLESSGDTDNKSDVHSIEGPKGSDLNTKLKSAVRQINKKRSWFNEKETNARLTDAIDYFLSAFYFARARLPELRGAREQQRIVLGVMSELLDEAKKLARGAREKTKIRLDWLHDIREFRHYTHMKQGWKFWKGKVESFTLYTVPIANLGSTVMSIWALGMINQKTEELNKLNTSHMVTQTRAYWQKYSGIARSCTKRKQTLEECVELADLVGKYPQALTVEKAKYIVSEFARRPLKYLQTHIGEIIKWISEGAIPGDSAPL